MPDGQLEDEAFAERDVRPVERERCVDAGGCGKAEVRKGRLVALLQKRSRRVAQQLLPLRRGACDVFGDETCHQIGVILGDVVEAVGDRAAHIVLGIVDKGLKDRQDRMGIADKFRQPHRPGQAWAGAFARQTPDMMVGVRYP
ncbi:hypothetical protein D3C72_1981320 [compost metagenome]